MVGRVLVVFALCLACAGCGGNDATETEQPAMTDSSGASSEVSGEAIADLSCLPLAAEGWSGPVGFADAADGVKLASDDALMVALAESTGDVVGYHSADGVTWQASEGMPEMWLGGERFFDVAGGPVGFVAVGVAPVVTYSPDGVGWEQIDSDSLPRSELRWFSGVYAGPEGFILVATEANQGRFPTLVWHSDDGTTWSDTDLDLGESSVAVTATEDGWMLLSADDADGPPNAPSRVWTSENGVNWNEVRAEKPPPARPLFRYPNAPLLSHDDTLVLVLAGAADDDPDPRSPTVWTSTDDGMTWSEQTVWEDPDEAGFRIHDTAMTDSGLLLAGYQDRPGQPGVEFMHHSADGISWDHCWTDPVEFLAIEPLDDAVVAITGTGNALVWTEL
jgi:hypothetical protein